jgi:GntR family transcriptional regulator / MocR family aminotransferase
MRQYDLSVWVMPVTAKKPNSLQIEEFIVERIQNRTVQPHEGIPSHRTLARLNKVNRNTALRAYTKLIATGWLTHNKGSKACVADPLPGDSRKSRPSSMPEMLPLAPGSNGHNDEHAEKDSGRGFISVGLPFIDKVYWPQRIVSKYVREFSRSNTGLATPQKQHSIHSQSIQAAILQQLNLRSFNIRIDHLLVIRGRSECMRAIFKALCASSDTVINTSPSDPLINSVLQECGINMIAINAVQNDFISQLEEIIIRKRIMAVYIRPNCSYPECRNLDEASCSRLVELAKKHQFYLIEEDDDHEFWWGKYPFMPLAHYAHGGFVIHCAALSRVSPYMQNLRTIVAPAQLIEILKSIPNAHYGYRDFSEEKAISRFLVNSELLWFSRQAKAAKQKDLKNLHELLQLQLGEYISYDLPESGTALWIRFPAKTDLVTLIELLKSDGQVIRSVISRVKPEQTIYHMRLDFGRFDLRDCKKVAIKLRSILKKRIR